MKISKIERLLNTLNNEWPKGLMLFANDGYLVLCYSDTHEIIATYPRITCDGGDVGTVSIKDKEYINL